MSIRASCIASSHKLCRQTHCPVWFAPHSLPGVILSTGLSNPNIANPIATPSVTTQYILTATNAGGCSKKDTVVVQVLTPQQCNQILVTPGFTAPDTVCVGTSVNIVNTSVNATSYYWNFCAAGLSTTPIATNIGNPGNLSQPVFMDYVLYNGNYYGFLVNYGPGNLIRLDFGNSLLNTPTSINLGNFGGIIPPVAGAEGIQIVQNEGRWYAIIVGGDYTIWCDSQSFKSRFWPQSYQSHSNGHQLGQFG